MRLPPHISFGLVGGRPVFLDLERDRYFSLDGAPALAFARLSARPSPLSQEDEASLLGTGLFEPGEPSGPLAPASAPLAEAQVELGSSRAGIADSLSVWRRLRRVNRELRSAPLFKILGGRAMSPSRCRPMESEAIAALARRFQRARASAPVAPRCLPDSLALWDWLRARGAPSIIVFGVKLGPFAAHCWVQNGHLALNEAIDRIAEYEVVRVFP